MTLLPTDDPMQPLLPLAHGAACIEPAPLTAHDAARLALRRDRAAGAAHAASMLLQEVYPDLSPMGRARGEATVRQLRDEAAVLRAEHQLAEAALHRTAVTAHTAALEAQRAAFAVMSR